MQKDVWGAQVSSGDVMTGNKRRLSIDDVVDTVVGGETGFLQEMSDTGLYGMRLPTGSSKVMIDPSAPPPL